MLTNLLSTLLYPHFPSSGILFSKDVIRMFFTGSPRSSTVSLFIFRMLEDGMVFVLHGWGGVQCYPTQKYIHSLF